MELVEVYYDPVQYILGDKESRCTKEMSTYFLPRLTIHVEQVASRALGSRRDPRRENTGAKIDGIDIFTDQT